MYIKVKEPAGWCKTLTLDCVLDYGLNYNITDILIVVLCLTSEEKQMI